MATEKIGLEAVLQDKDFQKGLANYTKGVDKATKKTEASAKKISKGWKVSGAQVGSALTGMAIGFAGVTAAALAAKKVFDFGRRGAVVTQTAESFDGLIRSVGASEDTLKRLRAASKGTVSDMTLMSSTTTLLAGAQGDLARSMASAAPQLVEIAKAANKLNPTLGDTTFLYQSLGTGIKRSSPLILDNLGLTIKIGEANERYAEKLGKTVDQLSAADKQQALLEETLRAGTILIEQAGGSTDSATDSFDRLNTTVANFVDTLSVKASPAISDVVDLISDLLDAMDPSDVMALNKEILKTTVGYEEFADKVIEAIVAEQHLTEQDEAVLRGFYLQGRSLEDLKEQYGKGIRVHEDYNKSLGLVVKSEWEHARLLVQMEGMLGNTAESVSVLQTKQRILNKTQREAAAAAKKLAAELKLDVDEMDKLAEKTGISREQIEYWNRELGMSEAQILDTVKAMQDLKNRHEALAGVLTTGILGLRKLGKTAQESAKDYKKALKNLQKEAAKAYQDIREKYEDSLPDKTSVEERMGMAVDAWDEWGLRMQDVVMRGAESPWWGELQRELEAVGMTKPPDVGIQDWITDVRNAFYEGDIPELINQDAAAWEDHAAAVTTAQQEETAAIAAANAEKKRVLQEQRAEEKRLAQQAREEAITQVALQIAEEQGLLSAWAQDRFGVYAGAFDTAGEVWDNLKAGAIELDPELQGIIEGIGGGLVNALNATEEPATTFEQSMSDMVARAEEIGTTVIPQIDELGAAIERQGTLADLLPEEDALAIQGNIAGIKAEIDTLFDEIPGEPFLPFTEGFNGLTETIVTGSSDIDLALTTAYGNIDTKQSDVADNAMVKYGDELFPGMIEDSAAMELALVDDIGTVSETFSTAATDMTEAWADFMKNMREDWRDTHDLFMDGIKRIHEELDDIPREIQVKVIVSYEDPTGEAQHGAIGAAGQTFLVGERGPELFTMPGAGMIIPNDISMNILAQVPRLAAPQGPATQVGGAVNLNFGDVSINNGMDWATFQAGTEQAVVSALRRGS